MKFPLSAFACGLFISGLLRAEETMIEKPAAPTTTPAATAAPASPSKPLSRSEEILRRFDRNGDGRLDDDEKADAHEMMLQEQMAKGANPAVANRALDAYQALALERALGVYQALALEVFDRNHDGRLDDEERRDAFAFVQQRTDGAMRDALLKRFDKNGDGLLDESERRESQSYLEEHRGELMQEALLRRFDKNANGQLDPDEKATIREAFAKAVTPPGFGAGDADGSVAQKFLQSDGRELFRAELLKRFDANGNGQLDPDEQKAAQDYSRDHRGEIFQAVMLRRFDKNGDGQLDETERATMRETLNTPAPAATSATDPENQNPAGKKLDAAETAALRAEIESRRAAREGKPPAPASVPPEKK